MAGAGVGTGDEVGLVDRRGAHRLLAGWLGALAIAPAAANATTSTAAAAGAGSNAPAPRDAWPPYAPDARTAEPSIRLSGGSTGEGPYACTLMPLAGWLPAGARCFSPDDAAMAASVLSTWPDGSASIVVVAGRTALQPGAQRTLRLRASTRIDKRTGLDPSRTAALVRSVAVDFGALGRAEITDFSKPERVWWANAETICTRYRASIPGHATLQAVVDIHAFATRHALVEVVVENSRMSTARPVAPRPADYTAIVSVDGVEVATVSSAAGPHGTHTAFRAWYASHWIGGDPGHRAMQDVASLQAHPLFVRPVDAADRSSARPETAHFTRYAADRYAPWSPGRQRERDMGSGGDHASIGPVPQWEAHLLQTGDARAARAVEASTLAVLGFNVNYRDSATGLVPDAALLVGRHQTGHGSNWPASGGNPDLMAWELAHHPAAGLVAFIARPAPVFIEIAQKVAVWNGTWNCDPGGLRYGWDGPRAGVTDMTGIFGASCQLRGRAWGLRSLVHATFLSPAGSAWRAGGEVWLDRNRRFLDAWRTDAKATLNTMWDEAAGVPRDGEPSMPGFQMSMWMYHFLVGELHRAAAARLLQPEPQAALDRLADWACLQPVRWINEQPNGGWRFNPYRTRLGDRAGDIGAHANWGEQRADDLSGAPSSVKGPWGNALGDETTWSAVEAKGGRETSGGGASYGSLLWAALVAAVERGLPGSQSAWETVQRDITDLDRWKRGFATDPRWGSTPRNIGVQREPPRPRIDDRAPTATGAAPARNRQPQVPRQRPKPTSPPHTPAPPPA